MPSQRQIGAGFLTWDQTSRLFEIPYDRDVIIGRVPCQSHIIVDDPFTSRKHVRIYTVDYDPNAEEYAPMLFAQNISSSRDSCFWSPRQLCLPTDPDWQIVVPNQSVLLRHGDRLKVFEASFTFTATTLPSQPLYSVLGLVQQVEHKVCFPTT